jgi:NitT/TauT family transport system substrate-binding protein
MKKSKLLTLISVLMILVLTLVSCGTTKTNTTDTKALTKVRLNEVVRSVFYAPMYAAIANGYFKEEGLDIELSTGQGAEATTSKTQVS